MLIKSAASEKMLRGQARGPGPRSRARAKGRGPGPTSRAGTEGGGPGPRTTIAPQQPTSVYIQSLDI